MLSPAETIKSTLSYAAVFPIWSATCCWWSSPCLPQSPIKIKFTAWWLMYFSTACWANSACMGKTIAQSTIIKENLFITKLSCKESCLKHFCLRQLSCFLIVSEVLIKLRISRSFVLRNREYSSERLAICFYCLPIFQNGFDRCVSILRRPFRGLFLRTTSSYLLLHMALPNG